MQVLMQCSTYSRALRQFNETDFYTDALKLICIPNTVKTQGN